MTDQVQAARERLEDDVLRLQQNAGYEVRFGTPRGDHAARPTRWNDAFAADISATLADHARLVGEVAEARTTNQDLHRRAQKAEGPLEAVKEHGAAAYKQWVDSWHMEFQRFLKEKARAEAAEAKLSALDGSESGWLIETWDSKAGEFDSRWFDLGAFLRGEGGEWTVVSTNALRFAREVDAQAYINEAGWTEAKPTEHGWSKPRAVLDRTVPAEEGEKAPAKMLIDQDWLRRNAEADPDMDVEARSAELHMTMAKRVEDGLAAIATGNPNMPMAQWDWFSNAVLSWCAELRRSAPPAVPAQDVAGVEAMDTLIDDVLTDLIHPESQDEHCAIDKAKARILAAISAASPSQGAGSVPDDVARLVVAARIYLHEDDSKEACAKLERATEEFSSRVRWDDDPNDEEPSSQGEAG